MGFLVGGSGFAHLEPEVPECLVFAFLAPAAGEAHRRLVTEPGSLFRGIFEYIRWLTHRPPRFAFYGREWTPLARHQPMKSWATENYEHFSRNFFIETLAWLVRSGLVRKLLVEFPGLGTVEFATSGKGAKF